MTQPRLEKAPWKWLGVSLFVLSVLGIISWFATVRARPDTGDEQATQTTGIAVEVVTPYPGGLARMCVQPGTVEAFDSADLYAKVSGYLIEQNVDIGSRVNKGDVLARISAPEFEVQVERDEARLKNARARLKQMEAHQVAIEAEARAADATVVLAKVMVKAKSSFRQYRERQLKRIKDLVARQAETELLQDEQEDYYLSALEAENGAKEKVNAAIEQATAARAKIVQATADVEEAQSEIVVAEADLAKAKVWVGYTVIRSPYTGVVTLRSYSPGDFIKAADTGKAAPLLSVERVDLMRVVVRIPDRDAPFANPGDPAVVEIDALPGQAFATTEENAVAISRTARAVDPTSRMMRTEVDLKNPDGILARGMYGRVTLILEPAKPTAVRVPSIALVGKSEGGRGTMRVVRGTSAAVVPVRLGTDNGEEVEILSGLPADARVIVRAAGPVVEGTPVTVVESPARPAH